DEVVVEALAPRGCRFAVALIRKRVLVGAVDVPFLRHQFAMLAHRQTRARLRDRGRRGLQVARANAKPRCKPCGKRLPARAIEHDAAQPRSDYDRRIAHGVSAARDADTYLAAGDALTDLNRRRKA